ncbi:MAG TPA: SH3 domain-containing protein [Anaerolineae bacterium]|nr:SH3 domain-containing protein [Anaerolineae bacterium]MCB0177399.1 SH3 domain-containing protein [Anaerolineae bacterium]MCB0223526.1 SH3 domain-containing protein [Anaerolineae bacterium]MCB9104658.1 SH3 domain-containing protein [Anaerolineales bacterium]HRV96802.1 SH3 domain-containing protein [Anaerolineae bacterium]
MKPRYWSLAIVLILINYLIFATLYTFLMETNFGGRQATRTPVPTFTPALAEPIIIVPTPEPITPEPSPTATRVVAPAESNAGEDAPVGDSIIPAGLVQSDGESAEPYLTSPGSVNIRSGPGPDYPIIGTLNPDTELPIVGRNANGTWWQIDITGATGWVANEVVQASDTKTVPVVSAPPTP